MTQAFLTSLGNSNNDLVEKVRIGQGQGNNGQHGYHFIVASLKILYPDISESELIISITDGQFDEQIDAVVIRDNIVDIYDFKGNLGYGVNDIRLFKDSVRSIFFARFQFDQRNQRLAQQVSKATEAIDSGASVRIRVARMNSDPAPQNVQNIIEELAYDSIIEHRIYSGSELVNRHLKIDNSPINYNWTINSKIENQRPNETQTILLRQPNGSDNIESLFCRLSLKNLVDLYYSQTPNNLIFESNVRSLQNNRKIKDEMLESLSSGNRAKSFHKLHNGITIVCDSISSISETRYVIENPQIVNGCQTVTNLAIAFVNDRESNKLKNGSVLCKVFHADRHEVERICLASNSQVSINPWDLRTNDPIQKKIESYLVMNGISYNRKSKRRSTNDLTFVELGQWIYAAKHRQPMAAKNNRRSIFDASAGNVYEQVFNDDIDLAEVLEIVKSGVFIRNRIKEINSVFEKQADLHFLASFFMLRNKNWASITKFNRTRSKIKETINYMHQNHDENMRYDTMFAKKVESWEILQPKIQSLL